MRSRYSAFAVGDVDYLLASWHPSTRPSTLELDPGLRWFRLDILATERGGMLDNEGTVEFCAHYREGRTADSQREVSRFRKIGRRWFYLDGR
jgi:SEC-C motif-containing protein